MKREQTPFCTCVGLVTPVDLTCKACGRPSSKGIGPQSASMLNTANLEVANFFDPELTWKTVKKGKRSASRRPRKPARTLDLCVQQNDKRNKRGVSSVSDSEKLGVAVLGRRFAEKIEHIPIKKRRLLLQSPSTPPQNPSPHREGSLSSQPGTSSPQLEDFDRGMENKSSGQWCYSDSVSNRELEAFNGPVAVQFSQGIENAFVNGKLSEVSNGKLGYAEDFSGILLLAAAACNNYNRDGTHRRVKKGRVKKGRVKKGPIIDDFLKSEGTDSSITPLERTTTSSESGNMFLKEAAYEDNIDGSLVLDNSAAVSRNFNDKRDSEARKKWSSMKEDRLHWDLNTVMEAWELPCDDSNENLEKLEDCVRYRDPDHALELLKYPGANTEVSTQVSKDKSLGTCPFPGSEPISNRPTSAENMNTSPTCVINQREDCGGTSAMQLGQKVFIDNVHLGKHDAFLLDMAVSDKVVCKSDSMQSQEVSTKTLDLSDNRTSLTELFSTVTCEYSVSKSGNSGASNPSPEHETSSGLGTTFGEGQLVVAVDVEKKQDKEAPTADAILTDSSLHVEMKELMPKSYECFGKVDLADPIDDGYGSDVSQGGHGHAFHVEKMTQIQVGYESPIEDGELRESVVYSCEENEVEVETECVDYGSDYRHGDEFNAANQSMSEVGSDTYLNDNSGSLPEKSLQCGKSISLKESSHSVSSNKRSGQSQFPAGREWSTERTSEADNNRTHKKMASESIHGLDLEGSSAGEFGSRATRGKLSSNAEEPSCPDALHRKDNVYTQRSRSSYDSGFQTRRMFGSERYLERDGPALPIQRRNQGDGHMVDSPAGYWNSRNHYQNGYPKGTGHPRPRNGIANSDVKIDGLTYRGPRRYTNYSSRGEYRPFFRRRSPADRDDAYSAPMRMLAARDNSRHIGSRGRSKIYGQEFNRSHREEFDGPMPNSPPSSSGRLPHYLSRSERSFSPIHNRGPSFSQHHRKSRSRSRSTSPLAWHLQRERNMGGRRLSRSPDFRSEARMGRVRMPFLKYNYAADDEDAFKSPPRTRFSPQRHSRWIDDLNCESADFRERKPPERSFGWTQKIYSSGSPVRIRPDDCFRTMKRPGRFTQLSGGIGRDHKYNGGNCERTKCHDKYEKIHDVRRHKTNGVMRRVHCDEEDSFEVHNTRDEDNCIKGNDRREMSRSTREERSPFRHNNERTYPSGPKLSRIQDYDEDASPTRG